HHERELHRVAAQQRELERHRTAACRNLPRLSERLGRRPDLGAADVLDRSRADSGELALGCRVRRARHSGLVAELRRDGVSFLVYGGELGAARWNSSEAGANYRWGWAGDGARSANR